MHSHSLACLSIMSLATHSFPPSPLNSATFFSFWYLYICLCEHADFFLDFRVKRLLNCCVSKFSGSGGTCEQCGYRTPARVVNSNMLFLTSPMGQVYRFGGLDTTLPRRLLGEVSSTVKSALSNTADSSENCIRSRPHVFDDVNQIFDTDDVALIMF